jgi:hypothetical protein
MPALKGIKVRCNICRGSFGAPSEGLYDEGFDFVRSNKVLLANGWSMIKLPWRNGPVHVCPCCSVMIALGIFLPPMLATSNEVEQ